MPVGEYESTGLIRESARSVIARGVRVRDGLEVVLKSSAPHVPPAESLARLRNEWFIARMFDTPRVSRVVELIEDGGELMIVFERSEGMIALDQRVGSGRLELGQCLQLALELVDALADIHQKSVVHKDVKPANILVDVELSRAKLIDFGIATIIARELGRPLSDAGFGGTAGYMPPEQTGRVNRPVDHRSDYYGLGATMYWMLSGGHPFAEFGDRSELIHAQLTRVPPLLCELDPTIPPVVARIVAKLLRKAAEDRYQGSFGLRADLSRCLSELDERGEISDFEIATIDPGERLQPPRRLHGREAQRNTLAAAHQRASSEGPVLVVVRGASGSGKTALVQELRDQLDERRVVFAACKFDQYTRASPHAGVGRILGSLLNQLTSGSLVAESRLHARAREALGPNGRLLSDIVPELEPMLGSQAEPIRVGPAEARDRFWDTLERFTEALLIPELHFVLFIDDVQWADGSSLRLLEALCLGSTRAVTIVLACRDQALDASHPLVAMLARLAQHEFVPVEIEVGALEFDDVFALVDDVLVGAPDSRALAELVHRRTQGTPLYVAQLLRTFYAEGIIDMDRARGQWQVDLARASSHASSGDVVLFLVEQFAALPERSRRTLSIAACIGTRFELETLAAAAGESIAMVGAAVFDAVASGYLSPMSSSARPSLGASTSEVARVEYGFVHDRIQQVALEALSEDRERLYLTLARALAALEPTTTEQIHAVATHIAHSWTLITDPDERRRAATLCCEAGARARAAAAFESAAAHYEVARNLLEGVGERTALLDLHREHAECLGMSAGYEAAKQAYARAWRLVVDDVERARLFLSEVTLAMVPGNTEAALELVMAAAAAFELDLRRSGSQEWIVGLIGAVIGEIEAVGFEHVAARPLLDDAQQASIGLMLMGSTNAAYLAGDMNLYGALGLACIRLGLTHGISDVTGVAFIQHAIVRAAVFGDYEGARQFTSIAAKILARFPASPLWGMHDVILGSTIQPWIGPIAASIPRLRDAHVRLRESGMLTNAGYAYFCVLMNSFGGGVSLPRVVEDADMTIAFLADIGDRPLARASRAHLAAIDKLGGLPAGRDPIVESEQADEWNPAAHFVVHAVGAFTCLMLGDDRGVATNIETMGPAGAAGTGLFLWILYRAVAVVHGCDRYAAMDASARAEHEQDVEQTLAMMSRWAASCPENARPFLHLLAGAWAQARGELGLARDEYTAAADAAAAVAFHHLEGLANERGATVLLELGQERYAVGYLEHARRSYARWGARTLERRVFDRLRALGLAPTLRSSDVTTVAATSDSIHALDVSSIVKMSLALSEATQLDGVLSQLLTNASENAGADRSAVLLEREQELEVHALQTLERGVERFEPALALVDAAELIAVAIVRDCVRSNAPVIVDDAWSGLIDKSAGPRSILALPIEKSGTRIGVLYLENRVTPGAFTHQRLRILKTLTAQAAVTVDNARLFDALREREAQWRALVDSAPDSIVIVDRHHRIEFSNHRDFGDGSEPIIGERIEAFIAAEDRERVSAAIDYVIATGSHASFEATRRTPAGLRRFTTRLGPILRELEREVDRVTLTSTDVTEQRELELQFRQAQKLQAVGTLAGGVAHDFNNLLTIILGACDLGALALGRLSESQDSALLSASFQEITEAADRAAQLTRQLLAFSRKQVLQPQRFDVNELVSDLARMLTRLIGADIMLELELVTEACVIHADRGQLEQVLMNLAVNARDAMPGGGTLTITTAHRQLGPGDRQRPAGLEPGRYVVIEVCDTGSGIEPELLRRIFEPFFTTKDVGRGTGLGLSTVLGIVEQSGGHVDVESQLGHGSKFRVLLPADDEAHGLGLESVASSELPRGTETILVVEDDDAVRRLAAEILRVQGYRVLTAADGDAASTEADAAPFLDLLLIDVVMPGASGFEVADAIARRHPGVKVIHTSGYTDDGVGRAGGTPFLQKPFTRKSLVDEVRRVLDHGPEKP
jgi:PAS domain S-box-containing protein